MNQDRQRRPYSATPALLSGGVLGTLLLAWLVLALFAPGVGSVIAVFGSPVLACFVIVRLLTLDRSGVATGTRGATASELAADPTLFERVIARDGERCTSCSTAAARRLLAVLPIGRHSPHLERRFVALCEDCYSMRTHGSRKPGGA